MNSLSCTMNEIKKRSPNSEPIKAGGHLPR